MMTTSTSYNIAEPLAGTRQEAIVILIWTIGERPIDSYWWRGKPPTSYS